MIFALDLEGVLAPEIWPILGQRFELPELALTTRDMADFSELMHRRVAATRERGLTLRDLQQVAHAVEPYLGAREFLLRLRAMGQVVVISDTFLEFSEPLLQKLGGYNLFANHFELDAKLRCKQLLGNTIERAIIERLCLDRKGRDRVARFETKELANPVKIAVSL